MVELPKKIPVKPPDINKLTKPIENNVPGVNRIFPLHKVVSQLNTLIADGTAMNIVDRANAEFATVLDFAAAVFEIASPLLGE